MHFGNHFALSGSARPKSEICRYVCHRQLLGGWEAAFSCHVAWSTGLNAVVIWILVVSFHERCSYGRCLCLSRSLGAEILIDDNPRYAVECAEHGIHVLLFDWDLKYPWSKTPDGPTHPLITRVHNWDAVEAAVQLFAAQRDAGDKVLS